MAESNIYKKMNQVKLDFNKSNVKKTGVNKHSGFKYYELADIQPILTELCDKYNLYQQVTFAHEYATLTIIDIDNPNSVIVFSSPMREISIAGCNAIQSLGGVETYQRRYLLLTAFDITEPDLFDAQAGTPDNVEDKITSEQVQWIKANIDVAKLLQHLQKPSILALTKVEANSVIAAKKRQLERDAQ